MMKNISLTLFMLLLLLSLFSCSKEPVKIEEDDNSEMVIINSNLKFTFGPAWSESNPDSIIQLIVELNPYKIGRFEITNKEYEKFVLDNGYNNMEYWSDSGWIAKNYYNWVIPLYWSKNNLWIDDQYSNKENTPVHGISFYEAEAYCKWYSVKTGRKYQIPTMYQWVRAAKGPDPGRKYPWGDEYDSAYANYLPRVDKVLLVPVNEYKIGKSTEGCYNMIGNAFEICINPLNKSESYFNKAVYYSVGSPMSSASTGYLWFRNMTSTSSGGIMKYNRFFGLGFRVVMEV
jgi:formylglycine-generating enzyme required for sulfatase activity